MVWYKNRMIIRYATVGFLAGFVFPFFGFLLEFNIERLPYTLGSFLSIQQTQPLIWIIELAPLVLGLMAGLMGQQHSFSTTLSHAKKEWETTFDAFSDPVLITDKDGCIIRCNHAVLDRLNSTSMKVLGRQLTDILSEGQEKNTGEVDYSGGEFSWFKRVYDTAICPIHVEGMPENTIYILHDITARKHAEAELSTFFAGMTDVIIVYDSAGRYLKIAPTNQSNLYRLPADMVGKTVTELFPPDQAAFFLENIRQTLKTGELTNVEYSLTFDNKEVWFSALVSPMTEDSVIWVARDITEQKRMEERLMVERDLLNTAMDQEIAEQKRTEKALRESEQRFQLASWATKDVIWERNFLANTILWSDGLRLIFHFPIGEIDPTVDWWQDHIHPDDRIKVINSIQTALEQGEDFWSKEYRFHLADGSYANIFDRGYILYNEQDKPLKMIGAMVDITERKQTEEKLVVERNLLSTLIDILPDNIFVKDVNSRLIMDNIAHRRHLGATALEEVVGKTDFDFFPKELAAPFVADEQKIMQSGEALINKEEPSVDRNGNQRWLLTTKVPLRDHQGIITGIVGINRDVTERKRIEDKLAEERNLLSTVIDNIPDYVYVKDVDSRLIMNNIAHRRILGATALEEIVGKTDFDFFPKELAASYFADEEKIVQSGESLINREESTVDEDGNQRWLLTSKVPLRNRQGVIKGIVGITRDVTEWKQAEERLVAERNLLSTLLENSPDYIFMKDRQSRFLITNKAHAQLLLGLENPEDLVGKTDFDLFPGRDDDTQRFYDEEQSIMETGQPVINRQWTVPSPTTGEIVWLSESKLPIRDKSGGIIGLIGLGRDITEQKRIELEINRQKQYFEALFNNSPVAIVVIDNDEKIVSTNPAFEKLYGYTSDEVLGAVLHSLVSTPETRVEAANYSRDLMGGSIHGIVKRRRKDGTLVDVELFGAPIISAGEKLGGLALYHDISEMVKSRREAEEANRAKSEFLANMSHEIRTPMNGVIGMLELALDTKLTPEQADYLQTSLHSAEALLSLLNDILDFSKIEAGKLDLEVINFSLRNAVEDVAYTLAKRAQDKGLEMACLVDPDLASSLRGDPGRLRQILVNLAGNAIKFTHQGEIVIRAEPREETDRHVTVHFSVQDTGIGIPYERQAAVFERFTQADGTTTRTYGGTGLGLTISKQLVEVMGGKIGLESKPGIGTTFWFDIQFEKLLPEKRGVTGPLISPGPVNLTHARILVVDDNQTNRMVLIKNVEALGSRVDAVPSGAKGIESLRNAHRAGDPYHVVLLDMQMPGMDGEQVARAIKSDASIKDVKILILTSIGQRGDATRLEALGCSGYLLKPVKQQMLFDAILAVLGRKEEEVTGLITRHILSDKRKIGIRLLLAEDNPINQKLAVILLQKAGYLVDAVETGAQALEKVQTHPYSAVLMDVQMPEMDGFEATRRIREWEAQNGQHIPIIAMTAHAMAGDRERCIDAGMDDYVTKPLEPRVLFSALDRWAQNKDSEKIIQAELKQDHSIDAQQDFSANFGGDWFGESAPSVSFETPEQFDQTPDKPAPVSQADSSSEKLPADLEGALFRFGGDRAFMMEMCQEFKDHLSDRVAELRSTLQAGEIDKLGRLAHNLKGLSMNFNAEVLSSFAAKLEVCGKQKNLADAPVLVEQIATEAARVQEYISQLSN